MNQGDTEPSLSQRPRHPQSCILEVEPMNREKDQPMENYDMRRFLQALKAVQPYDEGALGEECQYSHDEDDIE